MSEEKQALTIEEKDKAYVWHPFTQMKDWVNESQLVIESGEGIKLVDSNGKKYYDGVSSMWLNIHGHRKAEIDQAIIDQLGKIAHTTMLGVTNVPASELAEKLVAIAPPGLRKVFYSDSGSEAVEIAIKMAFQYWQLKGKPDKQKIIKISNAYHGDTIGSVSVGGIDQYHATFGPLLFKTLHAPSTYCYRCPLGQEKSSCGIACAAELEKLVAEHAHELAAVIVEPLVQGAAGILTAPQGYLKRVREIATKYDILMIVDEVAVGFGRTGTMFACEQEQVSPDIMTIAKGITAGYLPLAATMTTDDIYMAFYGDYKDMKTFFHGHSYTGNPLAAAAALANLEVFEKEQLLAGLPAKIAVIKEELVSIADMPHVGEVRQCGLMVGIELVTDKNTREAYPWEQKIGIQVCMKAREKGLITRPLAHIIVFMPPLASTEAELRDMLHIIKESIREITEV